MRQPRKHLAGASALLVLAGVGPVATTNAQTQQLHYAHTGDRNQFWGMGVAGTGDVNRDGHSDYAIEETNFVTVVSGRDGQVIRKFPMPGGHNGYPAMAGAGDVNKDGVPDLIVGIMTRGTVYVVSGHWIATQKPPQFIHTIVGDTKKYRRYGIGVDAAGDLNADGHQDILANALSAGSRVPWSIALDGKTGRELWSKTAVGFIRRLGDVNRDGKDDVLTISGGGLTVSLRSGPDGAVIRTTKMSDRLTNADGVGDVNADGRADFLVCSQGGVKPTPFVEVRSGKDMTVIHSISGFASGFGSVTRGVGDLDGDKVPDLVALHPFRTKGPARAFSGKTGKQIGSFPFPPDQWWALDDAGDVNADGIGDVIFGLQSGHVRVFSGSSLRLATDTHEISRTPGGAQTFRLDAGSAHANKSYLLVGSLSGLKPPLRLGNIILPLRLDAYLLFTAGNPNLWIANSLGKLDGAGKATAKLTVPAKLSPPRLRFDHAYVVFTPSRSIDLASNHVPLTVR